MENRNIAVVTLMAKLKDNSKDMTRQLTGQIKQVEKNAGEVQLKVNDEEVQKYLSNIDRLLDSKLKNIDLTSQLKQITRLFANADNNVEDYRSKLSEVEKELNTIASFSKSVKNIQFFSSSQINTLVRLNAEVEKLDKKLKSTEASSSAKARDARQQGVISGQKAAATLFSQKKLTHSKGDQVATLFGVDTKKIIDPSSGKSKTIDANLDFRHYGDLLTLFEKLQQEKKELGAINSAEDAEKHVIVAQQLLDTYRLLGDHQEKLKKKYKDFGFDLSKFQLPNFLENVDANILKASVDDLIGKYKEQLVIPVQLKLEESKGRFWERVSTYDQRIMGKMASGYEETQKRVEKTTQDSAATKQKIEDTKNALSADDIKKAEKYALSIDQCIEKLKELDSLMEADPERTDDYFEEKGIYLERFKLLAGDKISDYEEVLGEDLFYDLDNELDQYSRSTQDTIKLLRKYHKGNHEFREAVKEVISDNVPVAESDFSTSETGVQNVDQIADNKATETSETSDFQIELFNQKANEVIESLGKLAESGQKIDTFNSSVEQFEQILDRLKLKFEDLFFSFSNKKIAYHTGNLDDLFNTHKSESWTDRIDALRAGEYGAWGSGAYVTTNLSDLPERGQYYAIDLSKYNLYINKTEEQAARLNEFLKQLEKFVLASGDFRGFDEDIKSTTVNSLFNEANEVFKDVSIEFEKFESFINEMKSLVAKSGIDANGNFNLKDSSLEYSDSIPTRFMKSLGYQGVNNVGLSGYDNVEHGSVIYDLNALDPYIRKFTDFNELLDYNKRVLTALSAIEPGTNIDIVPFVNLLSVLEDLNGAISKYHDLNNRTKNDDIKPVVDIDNNEDSNLSSETGKFDDLEKKVIDVKNAIDDKTDKIAAEERQVNTSVDRETTKFEELREKIQQIVDILNLKHSFNIDADTLSSFISALEKLDITLEKMGKDGSKDLNVNSLDVDKKRIDNIIDFATAIEILKEAVSELSAIGNTNIASEIFKSLKISSKVPNTLVELGVALEIIKDTLDTFDGKNENVLKQLGALSNINTAVKNVTSAKSVSKKSDSGKQTSSKSGEFNAAKSYKDLTKKVDSFIQKSAANASGELRSSKSRKDFADLKEEILDAVSAIGKYEITTDEAKNAHNEFMNALKLSQFDQITDDVNQLEKGLDKLKSNSGNKIVGYETTLDQIKTEIESFKNMPDIDFTSDDDLDKYVTKLRTIRNLMKEAEGDKFITANSDEVKKFLIQVERYMQQNKAAARAYRSEFDTIQSQAKEGISVAGLKDLRNEFMKLTLEAEKAGKAGKAFTDIWKDRLKSLFAYLSTFASFYDIINKLQEGFQIIVDYDTALTEMKKVSDETMSTLQKFQHESFELGNTVGTTGQQIQASTADFLRLGESLDKATQSALDANTLFKISEFDNIEQATEAMISMSQAYQELEKAEINDILNFVGNNFAISTEGLATGLQKSAAALKTAGNDIYEAVALITSGNQIIQDADQVGAGIRTISLRILGTETAKDELAALGEDVDDFVVQTKSKIDSTIRDYTAVASNNYKGISILDDNGNYRSTYEILQDIADVYQEIVETDKKAGTNRSAALIEQLAGKNRSNIAASIVQNPSVLRDVYESAKLESTGSAQKELDAQLESISSHLEKIKNQWHSIWVTDFNRETINFVLDLGSALLKIVETLGLLPVAATGGGIFAFIKNFDRSLRIA